MIDVSCDLRRPRTLQQLIALDAGPKLRCLVEDIVSKRIEPVLERAGLPCSISGFLHNALRIFWGALRLTFATSVGTYNDRFHNLGYDRNNPLSIRAKKTVGSYVRGIRFPRL
ncbi:hypothetical protein AB7M49_004481 [Bradyrhizobium elkanii]